jgi:glycolate oxidase FAD binding subunit
MASTPGNDILRAIDRIQQMVKEANKVLPVGAGTKPALSRQPAGVLPIDMREISGIVEYEPAEYTITCLAGTPIRAVESALRANGQYLPFDPVFVKAGATVGGTVATGVSGSGRLRYGGIRDFILGARFVDGQGSLIRGGGKVVKNAAGFDFPKLLVGSIGRLGIIMDVTFKVFPCPATYASLFSRYTDVESALKDIRVLSVSPIELLAVDLVTQPGDSACTLATRIGGPEHLLAQRTERLTTMLPGSEVLQGNEETDYWNDVAEFRWADSEASLIKVPLTPARIPKIDDALAGFRPPRRYTVAGNMLWTTWTDTINTLHDLMVAHELSGLVLRGDSSHPLIGANTGSEFADRITTALDPYGKFQPLYPLSGPAHAT